MTLLLSAKTLIEEAAERIPVDEVLLAAIVEVAMSRTRHDDALLVFGIGTAAIFS